MAVIFAQSRCQLPAQRAVKDNAKLEDCAAKAFALRSRMTACLWEPDGLVHYRMHRPWPTPEGRTKILLQPLASMKRLAALLPAPYQNAKRL